MSQVGHFGYYLSFARVNHSKLKMTSSHLSHYDIECRQRNGEMYLGTLFAGSAILREYFILHNEEIILTLKCERLHPDVITIRNSKDKNEWQKPSHLAYHPRSCVDNGT